MRTTRRVRERCRLSRARGGFAAGGRWSGKIRAIPVIRAGGGTRYLAVGSVHTEKRDSEGQWMSGSGKPGHVECPTYAHAQNAGSRA
ncbi:hypothetical protein GCM10010349_15920 [Streptomyces flavofungini]|nr:hypothetical protein GCM10010349_15920 [Streptomyces flavofungini]